MTLASSTNTRPPSALRVREAPPAGTVISPDSRPEKLVAGTAADGEAVPQLSWSAEVEWATGTPAVEALAYQVAPSPLTPPS